MSRQIAVIGGGAAGMMAAVQAAAQAAIPTAVRGIIREAVKEEIPAVQATDLPAARAAEAVRETTRGAALLKRAGLTEIPGKAAENTAELSSLK